MSFYTSFGREKISYVFKFIVITSIFVMLLISNEKMANWKISTLKENFTIRTAYEPQLFCKDIFMIQYPSASISVDNLSIAMEAIASAKWSKKYMHNIFYYVLSTLLPSLIQETELFKGINGSNYTIPQKSKLDQMNWKLPFLPCRLQRYKGEDIQMCEQKRNQRGKQMRISFIGDSRVRRPMEYLFELLKNYNLTITTESGSTIPTDDFLGEKGNILWPKYKQKLDVRSQMLPSFHITYMWAPFLSRGDSGVDELPPHKKYFENQIFFPLKTINLERKQDAMNFNESEYIDKFKKNKLDKKMIVQMQSGRNNGAVDEFKRLLLRQTQDLPDFIFIGSGAWQLSDKNFGLLHNLDFWAIHGTKKIYKLLEELGSRTTVILILPQPFKDYLRFEKDNGYGNYVRIQNNKNLEWYLNAQLQLFPPNIHLWDSFLPVSFSSAEDCIAIHKKQINISSLPKIHRFNEDDSYKCFDRIHNGHEAIAIAVQMILNYVCNSDMNKNKGQRYCCDD